MKPDGGPAFPIPPKELGMTLRDYFAAQVLAGYWANPDCNLDADTVVKQAYRYADAMLKQRLL